MIRYDCSHGVCPWKAHSEKKSTAKIVSTWNKRTIIGLQWPPVFLSYFPVLSLKQGLKGFFFILFFRSELDKISVRTESDQALPPYGDNIKQSPGVFVSKYCAGLIFQDVRNWQEVPNLENSLLPPFQENTLTLGYFSLWERKEGSFTSDIFNFLFCFADKLPDKNINSKFLRLGTKYFDNPNHFKTGNISINLHSLQQNA